MGPGQRIISEMSKSHLQITHKWSILLKFASFDSCLWLVNPRINVKLLTRRPETGHFYRVNNIISANDESNQMQLNIDEPQQIDAVSQANQQLTYN